MTHVACACCDEILRKFTVALDNCSELFFAVIGYHTIFLGKLGTFEISGWPSGILVLDGSLALSLRRLRVSIVCSEKFTWEKMEWDRINYFQESSFFLSQLRFFTMWTFKNKIVLAIYLKATVIIRRIACIDCREALNLVMVLQLCTGTQLYLYLFWY